MADLQPAWLSTIAFCVLTAVGFIILAEWSAGGAAPWSIAAGVAHGIRDWADDRADPVHTVSPGAVEPPLPIDTASLPLPPLPGGARDESAAHLEESPGAADLADVEIVELTSRRT